MVHKKFPALHILINNMKLCILKFERQKRQTPSKHSNTKKTLIIQIKMYVSMQCGNFEITLLKTEMIFVISVVCPLNFLCHYILTSDWSLCECQQIWKTF